MVQRQQLLSGVWTTLATATLSTTGGYSFSVEPTSTGTRSYQIVKPADNDRVARTAAGTPAACTLCCVARWPAP